MPLRALDFQLETTTGRLGCARAGILTTSRGIIHTPAFMPVGTHAAVNGLTPAILQEHDAEILVCNAYRLAQQPGKRVLGMFSSVHEFMAWPRPILTDSGGFQVYRLEGKTVAEGGVDFPVGGAGRMLWTPEDAIQIQDILGSEFVMPLDVCISLPATKEQARSAMLRTVRWAKRSHEVDALQNHQTLFGIVQGAVYPDLRAQCIEELEALGFAAYAIGGLNVGESDEEYRSTLAQTTRLLPQNKVRYLMGVGRPLAMLEAVAAGIDLIDSIIPIKYAREGTAITCRGLLRLHDSRFARDRFALDTSCECYTCRNVSRAYLYHLRETTRTSANVFLAIHNVAFCLRLLQRARQAIVEGHFDNYQREFTSAYLRRGLKALD